MSHLPQTHPSSRWRLRFTAGYEVEHDVIVDSDVMLAEHLLRLMRNPSISSVQFDRYYGRQRAGAPDRSLALAGAS